MFRRAASAVLLTAAGLRLAAASAPPIGFAPPEIFLSDFNTRELRHGDFNRDGRPDLMVLNTDRGRIDLYLQREPGAEVEPEPVLRADRWQPVLSHPRFDRQSLIPGNPLLALAVGDFNADGADDFAVADDQDQLLIYHGPVEAGWSPAARLQTATPVSAPGSLAWDPEERALVLLGDSELQEIRWNAEDASYTIDSPAAPPLDGGPQGLMLRDVNGDGRHDVLYRLQEPRFNLAAHLRTDDGLGSVFRPLIDPPADAFTPFAGRLGMLLGIHPRSRALQALRFEAADPEHGLDEARTLDARFVHIPPLRDPQLLWSDLDRDGLLDALVLSPGQPELLLLRGLADDRFASAEAQPIPAGCKWMVEGAFLADRAVPQILVHDPDTGFLGLTWFDEGRLQFPDPIANTDILLGAAAWRRDGEETDRLVALVRDTERNYHLKVFRLHREEERVRLEELQSTPLPEVNRDPQAPLAIQLDGETGFLVASPFGDAFFLVPDADGTLKPQPTAKGFSTSLLARKKPADFLRFPPDAPLPSSWALLNGKTVQFLNANRSGEVLVADQLNLKQGTRLDAVLPLTPDGGRLGLLDSARNRMEVHERRDNGATQYERDLELPPLNPQQTALFGDPEDGYHLRIQGRTQLGLVFARPPATRVVVETLYETDLPETVPTDIAAGDFNGDGQTEIALVDAAQRFVMEFLQERGDRWESVLHFQMFEVSPGAQGRRGGNREPREMLVADMDGDSLDDLVLLIHDRILLYLQDPVPAVE